MKFENIQVGDEILVPKRGYHHQGYGRFEMFLIKTAVERITKTQFVVEGENYKKECGKKIGGDCFDYAAAVGEKISRHSDKVTEDQAVEFKQFNEEVAIIKAAMKKAENTLNDINHASHEEAVVIAKKFMGFDKSACR